LAGFLRIHLLVESDCQEWRVGNCSKNVLTGIMQIFTDASS
jgi:hypothetical protein